MKVFPEVTEGPQKECSGFTWKPRPSTIFCIVYDFLLISECAFDERLQVPASIFVAH